MKIAAAAGLKGEHSHPPRHLEHMPPHLPWIASIALVPARIDWLSGDCCGTDLLQISSYSAYMEFDDKINGLLLLLKRIINQQHFDIVPYCSGKRCAVLLSKPLDSGCTCVIENGSGSDGSVYQTWEDNSHLHLLHY